ncbi:ABC transporter permease [Viscerimonas tarda]
MNLVWKLLRENVSKVQLGGFFVANLAGMTIILIAAQFYFDINPLFSGKDDLFRNYFLTITKKVGFLNALSSNSTGFTPKEIEDLKQTGFVKDAGAFTPSQYGVYAGIRQGGTAFGAEMFFESVPDKFIDVKTEDWRFSPLDNSVPIILPKNYLDLYNFGFAESRSMPKISEGMIGLIALDVTIFGRGGRKQLKGRIAGFSNRINTILVPETFMTWANQSYGNNASKNPSRLMLEIGNIADPRLEQYFKDKGYEIEGENTAASRMALFLKMLVGLVVVIGAIICILSITILTLSVYLLLEKNMSKLQKLRLIGYSKSSVAKPYEWLIASINLGILVLSLLLVVVAKANYSELVSKVLPDFQPAGLLHTTLIGLAIFIVLSAFNVFIIRKKVR